MSAYRTHTCAQLTKADVGAEVKLSGWMFHRRDHGGVVFVDLRDNNGITQVVFHPECGLIDEISHTPLESVITIEGVVEARGEGLENPKMATGEIEVNAKALTIQSRVEKLPYSVSDESIPEELRLRNRYLDLRTERMSRLMNLRTDFIAELRKHMWSRGFREFQTPILTASSPEGARDYLVPSRLHPGTFYALPQAPQQFKQLLMASGVDKYFQVAPCFRDEDPRADRHPLEFYQLDMEMSFVEQKDVFAEIEALTQHVFTKFNGFNGEKWELDGPTYRHIPYAEAMLKYASDKPDLRNPIEISDVSDLWAQTDFAIFKDIVTSGGAVRAIPAKGAAVQSRSWFDKIGSWAQKELGAPAAPGYITKQEDGTFKGPLLKFLGEELTAQMFERCGCKEGDVVFLVASKKMKELYRIASPLRDRLGADLDLCEKGAFRFAWIVDYPMYEEEDGKLDFSHNPFSMPAGGLEALEGNPLDVKALQYDLICNGYEILSGAIRNHSPECMKKAFELVGYDESVVADKFGALYRAFKHGTPPHGGSALGIERMIMILADTSNIREVITFPANGQAQDTMMGSPSEVSLEQMMDLHIKHVNLPKDQEAAAS